MAASDVSGDDRVDSGSGERLHEVIIGQLGLSGCVLGKHAFIVANG